MKISNDIIDKMSDKADAAIGSIFLNGAKPQHSKPRTEVSFVASFVLGGIKAIAEAWERDLAKIGLRANIAGVFCHGVPWIRYASVQCELSDLLIVVDRPSGSGILRKAALVQAKMAAKKSFVKLSGLSSQKQLRLYQHWPVFRFTDQKLYGAASFKLDAVGQRGAGTFGVIDRHLLNVGEAPIWTQHDPLPTPAKVTSEPTLGRYITLMLSKNSAAGCTVTIPPRDDWSRLVELLMAVTANLTFKDGRTFDEELQRGYSAFSLINGTSQQLFTNRLLAQLPDKVEQIDIYDIEEVDERSPRAISVLHIEIVAD